MNQGSLGILAVMNEGESSEITFDTAGTFEYICEFHPSMEGRITVQ